MSGVFLRMHTRWVNGKEAHLRSYQGDVVQTMFSCRILTQWSSLIPVCSYTRCPSLHTTKCSKFKSFYYFLVSRSHLHVDDVTVVVLVGYPSLLRRPVST